MSALDKVCQTPTADERWVDEIYVEARAELAALQGERDAWERRSCDHAETIAALRQRCEDLELIARAAIDPNGGVLPLDTPSSHWHLRAKGQRFVLHDDNTGLPALTDEARKALRGGA